MSQSSNLCSKELLELEVGYAYLSGIDLSVESYRGYKDNITQEDIEFAETYIIKNAQTDLVANYADVETLIQNLHTLLDSHVMRATFWDDSYGRQYYEYYIYQIRDGELEISPIAISGPYVLFSDEWRKIQIGGEGLSLQIENDGVVSSLMPFEYLEYEYGISTFFDIGGYI